MLCVQFRNSIGKWLRAFYEMQLAEMPKLSEKKFPEPFSEKNPRFFVGAKSVSNIWIIAFPRIFLVLWNVTIFIGPHSLLLNLRCFLFLGILSSFKICCIPFFLLTFRFLSIDHLSPSPKLYVRKNIFACIHLQIYSSSSFRNILHTYRMLACLLASESKTDFGDLFNSDVPR